MFLLEDLRIPLRFFFSISGLNGMNNATVEEYW